MENTDIQVYEEEKSGVSKVLDGVIKFNIALIIILIIIISLIYLKVYYFDENSISITPSFEINNLKIEKIYTLDGKYRIEDKYIRAKIEEKLDVLAQVNAGKLSKISTCGSIPKFDITSSKYIANEKVYTILYNLHVVGHKNEIDSYTFSSVYNTIDNKKVSIENIIENKYIDEFKNYCEEKLKDIDYTNFIMKEKVIKFYNVNADKSLEMSYNDISKYLRNGLFTEKNVKNYAEVFKNSVDPYKPMIALTFDDGPGGQNTIRILNTLTKYNSRATFFVVGEMADYYPKLLKEIVNQGSQIGNHTKNHLNLKIQNAATITEEITYIQNKVFAETGVYPTVLRPPYGNRNESVLSISNMPIILWNIDTLDWKSKNPTLIANNILNKVSDGAIILMHDLYSTTADAVEIVVPILKERGYQMVTIDELIEYKGYDVKNGQVIYSVN